MNTATSETAPQSQKPVNVLVVDDQEKDFRLLSTLVKKQGKADYRFEWVKNSEEAERRLKKRETDIVAVDYNLGVELGSEVIARLSPQFPELAFILVTGNEDPEVYKTGLKAGAANFVSKGKDCGTLFDRSAQYALERKRFEHSLKVSNASKDWLMSLVAKDLGTPLLALNQLLSDLGKEAANMPREMLVELIETAYHASCEAVVSVNKMLEWGRSINGFVKPSMSLVDVERIITSATRLLTPVGDERSVFISRHGRCELKAFCDERMIAAVLRNLLSAAIFYSAEGETVVFSSETANRALELQLRSKGHSVNPALLSVLTSDSERLGSEHAAGPERQALSSIQMASHMLDAMGIGLGISNRQNEGVTFSFKLALTLPGGLN